MLTRQVTRCIKRIFSTNIPARRFSSFAAQLAKPSITVDKTQLFIDNKYVNSISGKTIDVFDPRNDQIIAKIQEGDEADMNIAIDSAYNAFHNGPWYNEYTASERGRLLNKFADLIEANLEELIILESWDVGKPLDQARMEATIAVSGIRYYAGFCDKINGATLSPDAPNFIAQTYREPVGVIGNILPWNGPMVLFLQHAAMGLACGNTMVAKPAETSPLTALRCAQLAAEAGIPEGVLNVVPGYGETAGQALCRNNKVSKISFTGETGTGKAIMKTASENLIQVSLELGGKSPCIIFPDANIDIAVGVTQMGTFANAGQVCCASTRIFCHESIYDEFVEKTIEASKQRKIGDNLGPERVDQGPQQNKQQFEKVMGMIQKGKDGGADVLLGGERKYDVGNFIETTVFGNVKDDMEIARNEIFGPCMSILKYNDDVKNGDYDDVLRRANNTRYGLAAGVITNDTNVINKARKTLQAGSIWVNCWNAFLPQVPFGGYKESGFGRIGGPYAIENFTKVKVQTQMLL